MMRTQICAAFYTPCPFSGCRAYLFSHFWKIAACPQKTFRWWWQNTPGARQKCFEQIPWRGKWFAGLFFAANSENPFSKHFTRVAFVAMVSQVGLIIHLHSIFANYNMQRGGKSTKSIKSLNPNGLLAHLHSCLVKVFLILPWFTSCLNSPFLAFLFFCILVNFVENFCVCWWSAD